MLAIPTASPAARGAMVDPAPGNRLSLFADVLTPSPSLPSYGDNTISA